MRRWVRHVGARYFFSFLCVLKLAGFSSLSVVQVKDLVKEII